LIEAVAQGDVDVAIVWGPFAGYFGQRSPTPLKVTPVSPSMFLGIPFTYGISAAVRLNDAGLRSQIQTILARECKAVGSLLAGYAIPLATQDRSTCESSPPSAF
jgi:mxaJ protein